MAHFASGRIEVGTSGGQVRIRVDGRGTHLISQPLREYCGEMMQHGYRDFVVDLTSCVYLDSTFAGVLAGISLTVRKNAGSVTLERVPPRCAELLAMLGIDPLFQVVAAAPNLGPAPVVLHPLPMVARSREAWANTVLEAHRLLAEAERSNERRFADVIEFLGAGATGPGSDGKFRN